MALATGAPRTQYAIISWDGSRWHAELRAITYDLHAVRQDYIESGLLQEAGAMARAQLEGLQLGDLTMGKLVRHARQLAADEGLGEVRIVPDAVWERAAATFAWQLPSP